MMFLSFKDILICRSREESFLEEILGRVLGLEGEVLLGSEEDTLEVLVVDSRAGEILMGEENTLERRESIVMEEEALALEEKEEESIRILKEEVLEEANTTCRPFFL